MKTKEEMGPALHHHQDLPSLMTLMFLFVHGLVDPLINLVDLIVNHKVRQIALDFHQDCLQLLHLLVEREQERWINRVSDRARDHHYQILNSFTFQLVMVMMTSHHRLEDNGNGLDRVSDHILTRRCLRNRKYNP